VGSEFSAALASPFRRQDWAAPYSDKPDHPKTLDGKPQGWKRNELFAAGDGKLFDFINKELLPHLHGLDVDARTNLPNPSASRKQRIIGRIMTAVERIRVDSETNLRDILDKVHQINIDHVDDTHFFTLSQVYEDLLLKMGEKNSDGGQFFTPREEIQPLVDEIATVRTAVVDLKERLKLSKKEKTGKKETDALLEQIREKEKTVRTSRAKRMGLTLLSMTLKQ
jgi:type I restriction enzyme M protein